MIGIVTDYHQGNQVGIIMPGSVGFLLEKCSGNLRRLLEDGRTGMHVTYSLEEGRAVNVRLVRLANAPSREGGRITDYLAGNQAGLVAPDSGGSALGFLHQDCSLVVRGQLDDGQVGMAVTFARAGLMAKAIRLRITEHCSVCRSWVMERCANLVVELLCPSPRLVHHGRARATFATSIAVGIF